MYYIIEREYVGPNQDQHCDDHTVIIQNVPSRTNSSNEERTSGWLGTTNDWSERAYGEFETLEDARAAVEETFGPCREADLTWEDPDTVVELYKVGEYEQMSSDATGDWIYDAMCAEITADTTDEEIEKLVEEWEGCANGEGYTLDSDADIFARRYRDELIEDRDDD